MSGPIAPLTQPVEPDREARVITASVKRARKNPRLRKRYNLGVLGWLTLGIELAALIRDLLDLYRKREQLVRDHGYGVLRQTMLNDGADPDLLDVLEAGIGDETMANGLSAT